MNARQYIGIFVACCFFALTGSYLGSRALPLRASADPAVGNGSSQTTTGTSQSGADPGGGICLASGAFSLCNPITGTITDSNATAFTMSSTTGPNAITSAATTGIAFNLNNTGSTTGDFLDIQKNGTICFQVLNTGNVTLSNNCGSGNINISNHLNQTVGCTGTSPTGRYACRGTSTTSSLTFTFNAAYGSIPACSATDETTALALKVAPAIGSVVVTGQGASDVIDVICAGNPT